MYTYTHLLHAHFSAHSACTVTFAHFSSASHTRTAQAQVVSKRCLLHMYHTCPSCLLYLMFHPSLLFLYIHFDISFQSTILPYFPVLKAHGMRISARAARSLAIWPIPPSTQIAKGKARGWWNFDNSSNSSGRRRRQGANGCAHGRWVWA